MPIILHTLLVKEWEGREVVTGSLLLLLCPLILLLRSATEYYIFIATHNLLFFPSQSSSADDVDSDDVELEVDPDDTQQPSLLVISRALCYSCRLIPRELSDRGTTQKRSSHSRPGSQDTRLKHLPPFVLQEATERENRNIMRDKIKDFLLEDT